MTTADDDDGEGVDDMALMKKRYEKQIANAATIMVATPPLAVHTEEPPTSPKSPSHGDYPPVPNNIAPSAGSSEPYPHESPSSDPEPQDHLRGRPSGSNEPAPLFSDIADAHLSILTDSDEEP